MSRRGRQAAREFAEVVPVAGMSDREKLRVYDKLRDAHASIKELYVDSLLDGANDEQGRAVDAVDMVLYMAERIFARMSE